MLQRVLVSTALMVFFSLPAAYAQLGPKEVADLKPTDLNRVKAGDKAPDFTLEDMDGQKISLSDFQGKKNVALVFYRGHW